MIQEKQGNVLDIPAGVIVHGCNSYGIMKSGIAKEIHERFPEAYQVYRNEFIECVDQGLPGLPLGSFTIYWVNENKIIVNAVTQEKFGRDPNVVYVDYQALGTAFESLVFGPISVLIGDVYRKHGIHFPLIGCGLANGDWNIVGPLIDEIVPNTIQKTLWRFPS